MNVMLLTNRIVEYVFFFGVMGVVAYVLWTMLAPFLSALALASIIVVICYPVYEWLIPRMPKKSVSLAAFVASFFSFFVIVLPLVFVLSSLVNEAVAVYSTVGTGDAGFQQQIKNIENTVQRVIPSAEMNINEYLSQAASWAASNVGSIFAGTAATIFLFFIALIGSFFLFRDGREFTKQLVIISPLPDDQDELILKRLAESVRSIATGIVLIALIQGLLVTFGLWVVGFERAILWGTIASFGALIPGVGTTIVLVPSIIYLFATGSLAFGIGLTIYGATAVGLLDNIIGPYLMSRGNHLHPFIILLSVLGGISVFGPIGFIVGPVIVSLFKVLLELYSVHIADTDEEETVTLGT